MIVRKFDKIKVNVFIISLESTSKYDKCNMIILLILLDGIRFLSSWRNQHMYVDTVIISWTMYVWGFVLHTHTYMYVYVTMYHSHRFEV